MAGLTPKQRVFVEHYLISWNATEAARQAGYAEPNKQGPRLLVNVGIAEAIQARLVEKTMAADEVLVRLAEHARSTMADFMDVDGEVLDLAKAERAGKLHLIKKFTTADTQFGSRVSIELYDAQSALTLIGKHHGLFTDKVEHSGEVVIRWIDDDGDDGTSNS